MFFKGLYLIMGISLFLGKSANLARDICPFVGLYKPTKQPSLFVDKGLRICAFLQHLMQISGFFWLMLKRKRWDFSCKYCRHKCYAGCVRHQLKHYVFYSVSLLSFVNFPIITNTETVNRDRAIIAAS